MKDYITYFYNIVVEEICYADGIYTFEYKQEKYILKKCSNSTIEMYYAYLEQHARKFKYLFKIIRNRDNRLTTRIDGKQYVLLHVSNIIDGIIGIAELKHFFYIDNVESLSVINHFPWYKFWEEKIDYMEKWFDSKREKYKQVLPWFNYFIGIGENALMYIKNTELTEQKESCDQLCFQHYRINEHTTKYEYYDPLNIIIDHPSRDIGEYIKSKILERKLDLNQLYIYLSTLNISKYWLKMLYGRIMFPSFFFDYMEVLMNGDSDKVDDIDVKRKVIDMANGLKKISTLFNEKFDIQVINWIKKT